MSAEAVVPTYAAMPAVRYGRPTYDFAAAPSLFVTEDLRQEDFSLAHRNNINAALGQSEVYEAEAVAVRRAKETDAAAALAAERAAASYAAETREPTSLRKESPFPRRHDNLPSRYPSA